MNEARRQQWSDRIDRLHARMRALATARRYDLAERARLTLRAAYDAWGREVFRVSGRTIWNPTS